ncbi:MAG: hypothetical protein L0387_05320 [Acidobacteria bacterium]|nr:hypothetical protein [Acidobacteriota bacterium]MCI0718241.1 hypothetical protein [Acidobacteriota bacterium]
MPRNFRRMVLLATVAVVSASVLMPPVCDLLFKCGCSWLWTTAALHCNIHHAAPPHCPWCSHGTLGYSLPYAGFIVGQFVAGGVVLRFTGQMVLAILITVAAILPVGFLMGLLTFKLAGYPHFIFFS